MSKLYDALRVIPRANYTSPPRFSWVRDEIIIYELSDITKSWKRELLGMLDPEKLLADPPGVDVQRIKEYIKPIQDNDLIGAWKEFWSYFTRKDKLVLLSDYLFPRTKDSYVYLDIELLDKAFKMVDMDLIDELDRFFYDDPAAFVEDGFDAIHLFWSEDVLNEFLKRLTKEGLR